MTSEPKWTKGPWHVETVKTSVGHAHKILPHNTCLYVDHRDSREVDAKTVTARANAYLQAAAPEMAEALEYIAIGQIGKDTYITIKSEDVGFWSVKCPAEMRDFAQAWGTKARAALAKARGES